MYTYGKRNTPSLCKRIALVEQTTSCHHPAVQASSKLQDMILDGTSTYVCLPYSCSSNVVMASSCQ